MAASRKIVNATPGKNSPDVHARDLTNKTRAHHCDNQGSQFARCPWAPRTFHEFAIKTVYVFDPWKTCCRLWVFFCVLESS